MSIHNFGLYHKIKHKHTNKNFKLIFDKLVYIIAIVTPLMTIPQALKIFINKNAVDLALVTWLAYLVSAFVWLTYGIFHKEKPIIINSALWIILNSIIIGGIFLYG